MISSEEGVEDDEVTGVENLLYALFLLAIVSYFLMVLGFMMD